jgi:hypothetical protein
VGLKICLFRPYAGKVVSLDSKLHALQRRSKLQQNPPNVSQPNMPILNKLQENQNGNRQQHEEHRFCRFHCRKVWFILLPLCGTAIALLRSTPILPLVVEPKVADTESLTTSKIKSLPSASRPPNLEEDTLDGSGDAAFAGASLSDTMTDTATAKGDHAVDDAIDPAEPHWEQNLTPKIAWLASYPNSGTSYTMTLVERASNLSTATNYGLEVTYGHEDSIPIYPQHEEGPFWEGSSDHAVKLGRIARFLPDQFIMTKTHCGGRCIKCPASQYVVNTTRQFMYGCQKTSYRKGGEVIFCETGTPMSTVARLIHLIRNPYHNIVARFHLERKNMISKNDAYEMLFPHNATGFRNWCHYLDTTYDYEDKEILPSTTYTKYYQNPNVPCRAEFYKWTQWHNYVAKSSTMLGFPSDRTETSSDDTTTKRSIPVHVVWYEDYSDNFNATFPRIMDFLQLPIATEQIQTFRSLPTYADHYSTEQKKAIRSFVHHVASPQTWKLIQHYF